jgi:transposase-like protein
MSNSDIEEQIREVYNFEVSTSTISRITDTVSSDIIAWQNRPLEAVYLIVWMDGIVFKVRENSKIINKTIYLAVGLNRDGKKEVLGMWLGKNESASFWLGVLTDLKARGVEDILITATDNLNGFTQTIKNVFPESQTQICVVHQIRNSLKYVASKDQKPFLGELKDVYKADTKELAEVRLVELAEKWMKKYPVVIQSWQNNWHKLSTYFKYTEPIRRIIYTTNTIEGFHRQVRKVTKTKGVFPNDDALLKMIYLAHKNISKKWTQPLQNWSLTISQLAIYFEGRLKLM